MQHDTEPAEPGQTASGDPEAGPRARTGEPRVDAAIAQLGVLSDLPVSEHPAVFERIHGELVEVLGELHSGAGQAPSAGQAVPVGQAVRGDQAAHGADHADNAEQADGAAQADGAEQAEPGELAGEGD